MTKLKMARFGVASLAILVVVSGAVGELRYTGICSLGIEQFLATCPLGFLERSLALQELLPQWPSAALVVLSVILLGRVFCAWICPTVLVRRLFAGNGSLNSNGPAASQKSFWTSYSPYAILGGVLLASFVFRFPVFCLFCPIGLFFGAVYAAIRFLSLDSPSLELVLFPAMLVLELWVLRSWCRSICPLGAVLSIAGNLNRLILPAGDKSKCLTAQGINCRMCERVCPEGIDLASRSVRFLPNSCTQCLECYTRCPAKAIKFPVRA